MAKSWARAEEVEVAANDEIITRSPPRSHYNGRILCLRGVYFCKNGVMYQNTTAAVMYLGNHESIGHKSALCRYSYFTIVFL